MKVYRISVDVNRYQYFLTEREEDIEVLLTDCTPRIDTWEPPPVYIYRPRLRAGDFYNFSTGILITSPKATVILGEFLEMAGELLPLPYEDRVFTLLNVTECINCLDREHSEWLTDDTGMKLYPTKYVFHKNRFSGSRIFKISETYAAEILVVDHDQGDEEEFRGAVELAQLQGLEFEELWNDQE